LLGKHPKDVKLVFKNFPLPQHPFARKAATAALAAYRQGKFQEFNIKLFQSGGGLSDAKIQAIAKDLQLNMDTFNRDMNDPTIQTVIDRDLGEVQRAEINSTPTIFINGKFLRLRSLEFQDLNEAVEAELKK
jgi:protein-disulfide isomerase